MVNVSSCKTWDLIINRLCDETLKTFTNNYKQLTSEPTPYWIYNYTVHTSNQYVNSKNRSLVPTIEAAHGILCTQHWTHSATESIEQPGS